MTGEPTDPRNDPGEGTLHPEVEQLLCQCIDLAEAKGESAVEEFLSGHPDHAAKLRGLLDSLRGMDLLEGGEAAALGDSLGPYELKGRLGQGGMGVVFLARQTSVNRLIALKVIHPGLSSASGLAERFTREAKTLAKLRHPNIVTVYDFGEDRGMLYTAMEFVPGQNLDELLASERPELGEIVAWIRDIARGLQAAHEDGVVHRDVKPSNIRITPERQAVLLDFGLAKDTAAGASLTITGTFQGSPRYASPEQVAGASTIDASTDVYSLGITLFEATTGKLPFDGATTQQIFQQILTADPERPRLIAADLPRDLETIILAAIERDPERRYKSAAAFADDLDALLTFRPIAARPPSRIDQMRKFARRNRALVSGLCLVILALTAGLIGTYWQYDKAQGEAVKADTVNAFLIRILTLADPAEAAAGKDFTVRAALDRASEEVGRELGDQPEVEAEVRFTIGNAYRAQGDLDAAEPHVRRALELRLELFGENHQDVANSMNSLALLLGERGEAEEAIALYRRVLPVFRGLYGNEHFTVARGLMNLGTELVKTNEPDEARQLLEESVDVFGRLDLPDHQAVLRANALTWLADLATKQNDRQGAIERFRETLQAYRATNNAEHPYSAVTRTNLGRALIEEGDFEGAEEMYLQAAVILDRHYDAEHAWNKGIRQNLRRLYERWNKPEEAAKYADRRDRP